LIYWRGGDYAGIGPGAHGRLTLGDIRLATEAPKGPTDWLFQVERTGKGESVREALLPEDRLSEFLMMGLRLTEGVSTERLAALAGPSNNQLYNNIRSLEDIGMLSAGDGALRVTAEGRPVLNAVLRKLLGA
jgi:oxygen-independent coproporphyrinogen-3 oxidase